MKKDAFFLYLTLAAMFITSLVTCNLIFQKFFEIEIWIPFVGAYVFQQSVGLLPYPVTFVVTDIISEVFGKKKANQVVTAGLVASLFMLLIVGVSNAVPSAPFGIGSEVFSTVFGLSGAAVFASMMAYLFAQYIDVRLFHFWKNLTKGKHLWLRNNASTIVSQLVDTAVVLSLLCYFEAIPWDLFGTLLLNGFLFKVLFAAVDTPIIYIVLYFIRRRFDLEFGEEIEL